MLLHAALLSRRAQAVHSLIPPSELLLQARNGLENYAYSMRNTIKDANLADKLSSEDKEAIEKAVDRVVDWLDHNQVRCEEASLWHRTEHAGWRIFMLPACDPVQGMFARSLPRRRRLHSSGRSWRGSATPSLPSFTRAERPRRRQALRARLHRGPAPRLRWGSCGSCVLDVSKVGCMHTSGQIQRFKYACLPTVTCPVAFRLCCRRWTD